jgi:hypothetical protein
MGVGKREEETEWAYLLLEELDLSGQRWRAYWPKKVKKL